MFLSIVILSYNHPELTARAIASVLAFEWQGSLSVVHNGSEPKHILDLKRRFPRINHYEMETNLGFSGGANGALQKGLEHHSWTLFLTNDCELLTPPQSIETLLSQISPAIMAPLIVKRNGKIDSLGGRFWPAKGRLAHCRGLDEFQKKRNDDGGHPYIPGSAFLIHRDVFETVGSFDETLGTYWEDVDFSQRVQELKFPILANSEIRIKHGVGKTCRKDSTYTIFYYTRNRRRVSKKYVKNKREFVELQWVLLTDLTKKTASLLKQRRFQDLRLLWKATTHY